MTMSARFAAGLLALCVLAGAAPAQAQFFFPGPQPFYPPPVYDPPPVYSERPYERRRRDYDEDRRYRQRPYYQPRRQAGYTCSTRYGACDVSGAPVGAGCTCFIPGYGRRGGSVTP